VGASGSPEPPATFLLPKAKIRLENSPEPVYNLWVIAQKANQPIKPTNDTSLQAWFSTGYIVTQVTDA
jgi:hypothetical protein